MTYKISIGLLDDSDSEALIKFAETYCETWSISGRILKIEGISQDMIATFLANLVKSDFLKSNFEVSCLRWLNINFEGN